MSPVLICTKFKVLYGKTLLANNINVLQQLQKLDCFMQYIKGAALLQQIQTKGRKAWTYISTHVFF